MLLGFEEVVGFEQKIIENFKRTLTAYIDRDCKLDILPSLFVIEPTTYCNMNCKTCPNSQIKEKGFMSFSEYKKIIRKIRNLAMVIQLYFRGEPLLHPNLTEMIEYAKKKTNAKVVLSTNALNLDENTSKKLISSGLDEIVFSVDYINPRHFEYIKRNSSYNRVINNILNFLEYVRKNQYDLHIVLKIFNVEENNNYIDYFKNFWLGQACDVEVCQLLTWANQLTKYNRLQIKEKVSLCAEPWFRCVTTYDGDVVLCCLDYNKKVVIGNLIDESVDNIWNTELIKLARQNKGLAAKLLCKNCLEQLTLTDLLYMVIGKKIGGRP